MARRRDVQAPNRAGLSLHPVGRNPGNPGASRAFPVSGILDAMKGLRHALGALLAAGTIARGAEEEPRRPRPPAAYSARVRMHEPPALPNAPPNALAAPDEQGDAPAGAPDLPHRASPDATLPGPARPDARERQGTPARPRDVLDRDAFSSEAPGTPSGWGWLADDVATNRARRIEQETGAEWERDADAESTGEADQTNRMETARAERDAPRSEEESGDRRPTDFGPVLGWTTGEQDDARPLDDPAPGPDVRLDFSSAGRPDRGDWSRLDAPLLAPAGTPDRMPPPAAAAAESRPDPGAARWILGGDPWSQDRLRAGAADSAIVPPSGLSAGSGGGWQPGGFAPFSFAQQEPLSIAPTPLSPTLNLAPATPSASRTLGGMGSEQDRATPKTLPW